MPRTALYLLAAVALAVGLALAFLAGPGEVPGGAPEGDPATGIEDAAAGPRLPGRAVEAPPMAAAVAPEDGTRIEGDVTDPAGRPVAGVRVTVRPWGSSRRGSAARRTWIARLGGDPRTVEPVVAETVSGEDGRFRVTVAGLQNGWLVACVPEPPRVGTYGWGMSRARGGGPVHLEVLDAATLRGRVVDLAGHGLAAAVTANAAPRAGDRGAWTGTGWSTPTPVRTDADGRFTLLAPPGAVRLTVAVPDRGTEGGWEIVVPRDDEVVLVFGAGRTARVEGRVTDTAGAGVPGVLVVAQVESPPETSEAPARSVTATVVSGADGAFALPVPAGFLQAVHATADGYLPRSADLQVPIAEQEVRSLDLVLVRGARVRGRVTDAAGHGIADAVVTLVAGENEPLYAPSSTDSFARTDAQGRYLLVDCMPSGPARVVAGARGWYLPLPAGAVADPYGRVPQGVPVSLDAEGQVLDVDVVLEPGIRVRGEVRGEDDAPVEGATVVAAPRQFTSDPVLMDQGGRWSATSGAGGRFELPGLPPGGTWSVSAEHGDRTSEGVEVQVPGPGQGEPEALVLRLRPGAVVRGQVVDGDGTPMAGAQVAVGPRRATSDPTGGFEVKGIPAGSHPLWANRGGSSVRESITLAAGETKEDVRLTLAASAVVRGRVVDGRGRGVARVQVEAHEAGGSGWSSVTGPDGTFEIGGQPGQRWTVTAAGAEPVTATAGDPDLVIVVERGATPVIEGEVVGPDGAPVSEGTIMVWITHPGGGRGGTGSTIRAGAFRAEVAAEDVEVEIQVTDARDVLGRPIAFRPVSVRHRAADGPLRLRLQAGLVVAGRVVDPEGAGVEGALVYFEPVAEDGEAGSLNPWSMPSAHTDARGAFRFARAGEGLHRVHVKAAPPFVAPPPVEVTGGRTDVEIRLARGLSITGRVLGPEGGPVPGARIDPRPASDPDRTRRGDGGASLFDRFGGRRRITTDAAGRFTVEALPAGSRWQLQVTPPGDEEAPLRSASSSEVEAGAEDVVIRLESGAYVSGRVVQVDGSAVRNAQVELRTADGANRSVGSSRVEDGIFRLGPVPPGRYVLTARDLGRGGLSEGIEVEAPARDVRIVVPEGYPVEGRLLGEETSGFQVTFAYDGGASSTTVDSDGSFTLPLPEERVGLLYAGKPGDERYALEEGVRSGTGRRELTLQPGGRIEGRVGGAEEVTGLWVSARARGLTIRGTADGASFVIQGLPPWTWEVRAAAFGRGSGGRWSATDVRTGTRDLVLR